MGCIASPVNQNKCTLISIPETIGCLILMGFFADLLSDTVNMTYKNSMRSFLVWLFVLVFIVVVILVAANHTRFCSMVTYDAIN